MEDFNAWIARETHNLGLQPPQARAPNLLELAAINPRGWGTAPPAPQAAFEDDAGNIRDTSGRVIQKGVAPVQPQNWIDTALGLATAPARLTTGVLGSLSPYGDDGWQVPPMLSDAKRAAEAPGEMMWGDGLTRDDQQQTAMIASGLMMGGGLVAPRPGNALARGAARPREIDNFALAAEPVPDAARFGSKFRPPQESLSQYWPRSWGPEDVSNWTPELIQRAKLLTRQEEARAQWSPLVDDIMWPDKNSSAVMSRSEAEAKLLNDRPELKAQADAIYSAKRDWFEHDNPNWQNDPYLIFNEPRYPGDDLFKMIDEGYRVKAHSSAGIDQALPAPKKGGEQLFSSGSKGGAGVGAVEAMAGGQPKGITAWHGSPHDFDKFSMDKIGTGEGAQAYGHGLYFAENEAAAQYYKTSGGFAQGLLNEHGSIDAAIEATKKLRDDTLIKIRDLKKPKSLSEILGLSRRTGHTPYEEIYLRDYTEALAELEKAKLEGKSSLGNLYQVHINAEPEQFLDWDKPLSQQSPIVRAFAADKRFALVREDGSEFDRGRRMSMQEATEAAKRHGWDERSVVEKPGDDLPGSSFAIGDGPDVAKALRDAGVAGVRYLDGKSRADGAGSSNYVVFDDSLVEMLHKWRGGEQLFSNASPYPSLLPLYGYEDEDPGRVNYLEQARTR